jgi:chromosomal replication initiator protein
MNVDELWTSVLGELELEVSRATFASFFKGTRLALSDEGKKATIKCQNRASFLMLQNRYAPLLSDRLETRLGTPVEVRYELSQKEKDAVPAGPLFSAAVDREKSLRSAGLNPKYSFENFAVSETNQMAFAAAQAVAERPGKAYNPLFLWGATGVGKTHLMQAIGKHALSNNPSFPLIYCTGEEFTNEIIEAIRTRSAATFKKRFRNTKLLLVDDVQFIAGKESVQMEFFHTFNSVLNSGGQIVMTSDKPPASINALEARLRSRFEGGLIIDINPPNFELRTAIVLIKANEWNITLPMDVARALAANTENARSLEGLLLRYITEEQTGAPTEEIVSRVLATNSPQTNVDRKRTSPDRVLDAVSSHYGIRRIQLSGPGRKKGFVLPRHVCMFVLRQDLGLPYKQIGFLLGGRDHTSVIHGVEKIQALLPKSELIRGDLSAIRRVVWG